MQTLFSAAIVLIWLGLTTAAQGQINEISVWQRATGNFQDRAPEPKDLRRVKIPSGDSVTLFDAQYGKKIHVKGARLKELWSNHPSAAKSDLVILHLTNGMIIPIPKGDLEKADPFIATSTLSGSRWRSEFPAISRPHPRFKDPRPLDFSGNKIVVASLWHPYLSEGGINYEKKSGGVEPFSPWKYAGSLLGIEFADARAYERQFRPELAGYTVFRNRCQYCHGVGSVGAGFGWDYLEPLPIHSLKQTRQVFQRVKYPDEDAMLRGVQMPNQGDITLEEIKLIWTWVTDLSKRKLLPYEP
jgi:hypothetical protein